MINEELFKKEVLEKKAPFRIFETKTMKSLIRQLNLYGFSKKRQTFQRSASLPVFLEEENNVSLSRKVFQHFHSLAIRKMKSCDLESMFTYVAAVRVSGFIFLGKFFKHPIFKPPAVLNFKK